MAPLVSGVLSKSVADGRSEYNASEGRECVCVRVRWRVCVCAVGGFQASYLSRCWFKKKGKGFGQR